MKPRKTLTLQNPLLQNAITLYQQGKLNKAAILYKKLLKDFPTDAKLLNTLGTISLEAGQSEESVRFNRQSLKINPNQPLAWLYLGVALKRLNRSAEAVASYDSAISLQADYAEAYCNRGNALQDLTRFAEALASYDRAIAIKPNYAMALLNRGIALRHLKRLPEAISSYESAIAVKPDFVEAYCSRGIALQDLNRLTDALASFEQAIGLRPNYADAYYNRGLALYKSKQYPAAIIDFQRALHLKPDYDFLYGQLLHAKLQICDWRDIEAGFAELAVKIARNEKASYPFAVPAMLDSPALQQKAAWLWTQEKYPTPLDLPKRPKYPAHSKIRIGYFSADFRHHPVAYLTAELFELHDRNRFEITAFSFSAIKDAMTQRLAAGFDRFIECHDLSDQELVQLAGNLEIDIAVDLSGHTRESRTQVFAMRLAPVQVNYLGYPGTMGAGFMDYIIADKILIPEHNRAHFAEKITYLPNSYLAHDSTQPIADTAFRRAEFGLPDSGFVFCCFNNSFKLNSACFSSWMRILTCVAGSVLWLPEDNPIARDNLLKAAVQSGVEAERLVFAQRMPRQDEHLARLRLADLFLDTLPYNAHTTANDALWVGLPVLTCLGEAFAGRVAASLLTAIGLPELITSTRAEYENLAIDLATQPMKLAGIKTKLAQNRLTSPLFNSQLFTRHIEAAYAQMYARYQADLPPEDIYV